MHNEEIPSTHAVVDALFHKNAGVFGPDLDPYRHHVHRVVTLVELQMDIEPDLIRPLAIAAFFHDAAIWFDRTWDYLPKSIERALEELGPQREQHESLVTALIAEHHRIRHARHGHPLVEAFRRADMADVCAPLVGAPRVSRSRYRSIVGLYPYSGFRRMLAKAFVRGLRENAFRPMPMVKF